MKCIVFATLLLAALAVAKIEAPAGCELKQPIIHFCPLTVDTVFSNSYVPFFQRSGTFAGKVYYTTPVVNSKRALSYQIDVADTVAKCVSQTEAQAHFSDDDNKRNIFVLVVDTELSLSDYGHVTDSLRSLIKDHIYDFYVVAAAKVAGPVLDMIGMFGGQDNDNLLLVDDMDSIMTRANQHMAIFRKDAGQACHVFGDPHFVTFDGNEYDYHAVGTFVLSQYPRFPSSYNGVNYQHLSGYQYMLQAMFSPVEVSSIYGGNATRMSAVAFKTKRHTLHYFFDSKAIFLDEKPYRNLVAQTPYTTSDGTFTISWSGDKLVLDFSMDLEGQSTGKLVIKGSFLTFVAPADLARDNVAGLCGDYDGCPANDLSPSAEFTYYPIYQNDGFYPTDDAYSNPVDSAYLNEYQNEYAGPLQVGYTWSAARFAKYFAVQVNDFSLFHGFQGMLPRAGHRNDVYPENTASWTAYVTQAAEDACSVIAAGTRRDNCIFDVALTGDLSWVSAYTDAVRESCEAVCAGSRTDAFVNETDCGFMCKRWALDADIHQSTCSSKAVPADSWIYSKNEFTTVFTTPFGGSYKLNIEACGVNDTVNVNIRCSQYFSVNTAVASPASQTEQFGPLTWGFEKVSLSATTDAPNMVGSSALYSYSWAVISTSISEYSLVQLTDMIQNRFSMVDASFTPPIVGSYELEFAIYDGCYVARKSVTIYANCLDCHIQLFTSPVGTFVLDHSSIFPPMHNARYFAYLPNPVIFPPYFGGKNYADNDIPSRDYKYEVTWELTGVHGARGTKLDWRMPSSGFGFSGYQHLIWSPVPALASNSTVDNYSSNWTYTNSQPVSQYETTINTPVNTKVPISRNLVQNTFFVLETGSETTTGVWVPVNEKYEYCAIDLVPLGPNNEWGLVFEPLSGKLSDCVGVYYMSARYTDLCNLPSNVSIPETTYTITSGTWDASAYPTNARYDTIPINVQCSRKPVAVADCAMSAYWDNSQRAIQTISISADQSYDPDDYEDPQDSDLNIDTKTMLVYRYFVESSPAVDTQNTAGTEICIGNNNQPGQTTCNLVHPFPGTYRIRVEVSDGCSMDSTTVTIVVSCPAFHFTMSTKSLWQTGDSTTKFHVELDVTSGAGGPAGSNWPDVQAFSTYALSFTQPQWLSAFGLPSQDNYGVDYANWGLFVPAEGNSYVNYTNNRDITVKIPLFGTGSTTADQWTVTATMMDGCHQNQSASTTLAPKGCPTTNIAAPTWASTPSPLVLNEVYGQPQNLTLSVPTGTAHIFFALKNPAGDYVQDWQHFDSSYIAADGKVSVSYTFDDLAGVASPADFSLSAWITNGCSWAKTAAPFVIRKTCGLAPDLTFVPASFVQTWTGAPASWDVAIDYKKAQCYQSATRPHVTAFQGGDASSVTFANDDTSVTITVPGIYKIKWYSSCSCKPDLATAEYTFTLNCNSTLQNLYKMFSVSPINSSATFAMLPNQGKWQNLGYTATLASSYMDVISAWMKLPALSYAKNDPMTTLAMMDQLFSFDWTVTIAPAGSLYKGTSQPVVEPYNHTTSLLCSDPPNVYTIGGYDYYYCSTSWYHGSQTTTGTSHLKHKYLGNFEVEDQVYGTCLIPDVVGDYKIVLTVSDYCQNSFFGVNTYKLDYPMANVSATCNAVPTIPTITPQHVFGEGRWLLDASAATDSDGDALTFEWSFTVPNNNSGLIATGVQSAVATVIVNRPGTYTATVKVCDSCTCVTQGPISLLQTSTTKLTNGQVIERDVAVGEFAHEVRVPIVSYPCTCDPNPWKTVDPGDYDGAVYVIQPDETTPTWTVSCLDDATIPVAISVTDLILNAGVSGATLTITGTSSASVSTASDGNVVAFLVPGSYTAAVSATGYIPITAVSFTVLANATNKVAITMKQASLVLNAAFTSYPVPANLYVFTTLGSTGACVVDATHSCASGALTVAPVTTGAVRFTGINQVPTSYLVAGVHLADTNNTWKGYAATFSGASEVPVVMAAPNTNATGLVWPMAKITVTSEGDVLFEQLDLPFIDTFPCSLCPGTVVDEKCGDFACVNGAASVSIFAALLLALFAFLFQFQITGPGLGF